MQNSRFTFNIPSPRTINEIRKMVFVFASQQAKRQQKEAIEDQLSWAQILRAAWQEMKSNSASYKYIEFVTVKGKLSKRIALAKEWNKNHEVKGTGRPTAETQVLYTDAIKYIAGDAYNTGSFFTENLINSF